MEAYTLAGMVAGRPSPVLE
ncbi:hypothetical protein A2U01_0113626, partial [Trifolium medium]|nr:hypothetical protein [Trifolium medium]